MERGRAHRRRVALCSPERQLDREAVSRGNSVYLADRVIPMLPEALSNGLCSLRPDEDHLTFSVFAEINSQRESSLRALCKERYPKRGASHLQGGLCAFAIARRTTISRASSTPPGNWRHSCGASVSPPARFDLEFPEVKVWLDAQGTPLRLEKIENDSLTSID